jgi:anti-sigma factor RsiW
MSELNRAVLHAYLDDALDDAEMARVEQLLRSSDSARQALVSAMDERDRGEHSLGAIWRREHLTCPTREQLSSYLLGVLDDDLTDYLKFHLETIGCRVCTANLADLQALQRETPPESTARRRRYFTSSASLLPTKRDSKK